MADEKKTYVVKPGFTHGVDDRYKAGDTVELTDAEAVGLSDKLELVKGGTRTSRSGDSLWATAAAALRYNLRSAIAAASDDELLEVPYVTKRNLPTIRAWANDEKASKPASTDTGLKDGKPVTGDTATVPADAVGEVEKDLEAETGKEFVKTGDKPPTLVETDKPASDNLGNPPGQ